MNTHNDDEALKLNKLKLLFNSSYQSFFDWLKLRILNEDLSLKEDKKGLVPNLTPDDFKDLEATIKSGVLEYNPKIVKTWKENLPADFKFVSAKNANQWKALSSEKYNDWGKLFDKWRNGLYVVNKIPGGEKTKESGGV